MQRHTILPTLLTIRRSTTILRPFFVGPFPDQLTPNLRTSSDMKSSFVLTLAIFLVTARFNVCAEPLKVETVGLRDSFLNTRPQPAEQVPLPPEPDIDEQRKDVAEQLRIAERRLDSRAQAAAHDPLATEDAERHVGVLKQLDVIYAQQESAERRGIEISKKQAKLEHKLADLLELPTDRSEPHSFLLLDRLRSELATELVFADAMDNALMATTAAVQTAAAAVDAKQIALRNIKESLETNPDDINVGALQADAKVAEAETDLAEATLKLRQLEAENETLAAESHQIKLRYLEKYVEVVAANTQFSQTDLDHQQFELDKRESHLDEELRKAEALTKASQQLWLSAQQRWESTTEKTTALEEEVDARRRAYEVQQYRVTVAQNEKARIADQRIAWRRRLRTFNRDLTIDQNNQWIEETKSKLAELDRQRQVQAFRADEGRKNLSIIESTLEKAKDESPKVVHWLREQTRSTSNLLKIHEVETAAIIDGRRVHERLLNELTGGVRPTLGDWIRRSWSRIGRIWSYPIGTIKERNLTVGEIITGCTLFLFGLWLSRRISRTVGKKLLPRLGMDASEAATLQTIVYYFLICLFALLALKYVNVPLTAFALLGGALALGLGFGSQNIINNFISGLILLAERPIKVGDLVEINDLYGNVEHIGARSTRIKTGAHLEIIVPNSSFLETNVVNWTLSDDKVRTAVKVGVAYGSPTTEVKELLLKALRETAGVMQSPLPIVLFSDFGADSLNFEAHFWIRMRNVMQRWQLESEVRFKIDEEFNKAGIVIAFPQRDVHLASAEPLRIKLVDEKARQAA